MPYAPAIFIDTLPFIPYFYIPMNIMNSNQTTPLRVAVADPSAALTAASTTVEVVTQTRTKPGTVKPTVAALVRTLNGMPEMHELANLFPAMSARAKAALSADIKQNGQQVPIILWEGKVVDGRHRAQVCLELGIPITAIDYAGDSTHSILFGV